MKVLFVEPPSEFWFVMGEYLPPPFGIIQLAAYRARYRSFYGSWRRRLGGLFSSNKLKSRLYRHMMRQGVIRQFKNLIQLPI